MSKFRVIIEYIVDDEHVHLHNNNDSSPEEIANVIQTDLEEDIEMYIDESDNAQYLLATIENSEKINVKVSPIDDLDLDFDFEDEDDEDDD